MTAREIGKRAAEEIRRRASREDTYYVDQYAALGLAQSTLASWECRGCAPRAVHLARMAEAGYDVIYILTGKRTKKEE